MGGIIQRGPGIATVEAAGVTPNGRITPEDVGIWKDSQIEPFKKIVEFAHSQNQNIMIQLAHAGRKASTVAPWLSSGAVAGKELNGWPDEVYGPSAIQWNENHAQVKEMSLQDIEDFKAAYAAAVKRALAAGFDAIEIHNAHGVGSMHSIAYLRHLLTFCSLPLVPPPLLPLSGLQPAEGQIRWQLGEPRPPDTGSRRPRPRSHPRHHAAFPPYQRHRLAGGEQGLPRILDRRRHRQARPSPRRARRRPPRRLIRRQPPSPTPTR